MREVVAMMATDTWLGYWSASQSQAQLVNAEVIRLFQVNESGEKGERRVGREKGEYIWRQKIHDTNLAIIQSISVTRTHHDRPVRSLRIHSRRDVRLDNHSHASRVLRRRSSCLNYNHHNLGPCKKTCRHSTDKTERSIPTEDWWKHYHHSVATLIKVILDLKT